MCNSILDELKEVKCFTRNKRFHKKERKKMFEESSGKSSVVFRIQAITYDGVFL